MFKKIAVVGLLAVGLAFALVASANAESRMTKDFVQKVYSGDQFEMMSGQMALQKSNDSEVKSFAQQMIDDHTKAGQDMAAAIAQSKEKITEPKMMDSKHQKMLDSMDKLSGADFDKKYIQEQVDAHKEMVALFSDYAKKGDDTALRDFASNTLPTLRQHQERIMRLKDTYGR